jgi:hypothetical protein
LASFRRFADAALAAILLTSTCCAQIVVNPARLRRFPQAFEPKPGEVTLRCEVTPMKPVLDYGFRFQTGYRVLMSMSPFEGKGHTLSVFTRVTPRAEGTAPVHLLSRQSLPEIPKTKQEMTFGGSFLIGEGAYDVNWVLVDERNRVCRKNWHLEVKRSHAERTVTVAMPPNTVWDYSLRGARLQPKPADDAEAIRLSILINAAPLYQRRTRLHAGDVGTLMSALGSLLEHVPTRGVRLVVFNLEQQRELYRNTDFKLSRIPEVAATMNAIELNTVDYQVLKNRRGHVDLVADMVNQEIQADPQSDVVLVMGPESRFFDRMPAERLLGLSKPAPRFLNLQIIPLMASPTGLPDVIGSAVARLGGKTVAVHSPGDFAKAIARLEENRR